jgi:hypothetical protein
MCCLARQRRLTSLAGWLVLFLFGASFDSVRPRRRLRRRKKSQLHPGVAAAREPGRAAARAKCRLDTLGTSTRRRKLKVTSKWPEKPCRTFACFSSSCKVGRPPICPRARVRAEFRYAFAPHLHNWLDERARVRAEVRSTFAPHTCITWLDDGQRACLCANKGQICRLADLPFGRSIF